MRQGIRKPGGLRWSVTLCCVLFTILAGAPAGAEDALPKLLTGIAIGASELHPEGTLQTPTGGRHGTSTRGRPSLDELGLGGEGSWWVALEGDLGRSWSWHLQYAHVKDEGEAVLEAPLTTQGRRFAFGETLQTRTTFHEYWLGVAHRVVEDERRAWHVGIRLGATAFLLEMLGSGMRGIPRPAGDRVYRAYHVMEVGAITRFEHRFGPRWRGELAAFLAPRIHRYAGRGLFEARLIHTLQAIDVAVGARYDTFEFHDAYKQELPNHLDLRRLWLPEVSVRLNL